MPTRKIRDVIRGRKILTATGDLNVREAARRMMEAQVGSIVIMSGNQLAGIFTERDMLTRIVAAGRDPDTTRLDDVMTRHPQTVTVDKPLGHALHLMHECGFRHMPVVEGERLIGMVSARDALATELLAFEDEIERRETITEVL